MSDAVRRVICALNARDLDVFVSGYAPGELSRDIAVYQARERRLS